MWRLGHNRDGAHRREMDDILGKLVTCTVSVYATLEVEFE